ncbi:MAG: protein-L-isoaspartate O-methyltransferase [Phyllobacteriaceae bacterium]|nr:protein-L-isoaspartate O-methyltransferase [Phyllobacteriaceae bacterium]
MADFAIQRRTMVDNQIRTVDVTDHGVLAAFLTVGREAFVPPAMQDLAYLDRPIDFGGGRRSMQPAQLAKLVQLARPQAGEKVLIVGGATGYTAAIVAELGASVVVLEENAELAGIARAAFAGNPAIEVVSGPLTAGHAAGAPYDLVLFDGAVEEVPEAIVAQVGEFGRLVYVEGEGNSALATVAVRAAGKLSPRPAFNLPGHLLPGFARPAVFAL